MLWVSILRSFRYFEKRSLFAIYNSICSIPMSKGNVSVTSTLWYVSLGANCSLIDLKGKSGAETVYSSYTSLTMKVRGERKGLTIVDLDIIRCYILDWYCWFLCDIVLKSGETHVLRGSLELFLFLIFLKESRTLLIWTCLSWWKWLLLSTHRYHPICRDILP